MLFFFPDYIQGLGGYDPSPANMKWAAAGPRVQLWHCPINSSRDDIDPLFQNDGNQLLFASKPDWKSIGGYDVYVVYFKEQITDQFAYTEDLPCSKD